MTRYDLIVRGGALVTPEGVSQADIAVSEGQVAALGPELSGSAGEEIDAAGLHIFPGVVDAHVHFNEPGRAEWEGIKSGSEAVAAGGGTTYFDMPLNAHPPVTDARAFTLKRQIAENQSLVDFGLWGGIVPGNGADIEELAGMGVVGFKAFMSNSGIEDFPCVDDATLFTGMQRAGAAGRIVAVHAENESITAHLAREAVSAGKTGVRDYLRSRPVIAEVEAIGRAILLAEEARCPLHIVHVSSGRGVAIVAEAASRGVDVSCETCPHYLALTGEDVERLGAIAKCAPPLRDQSEADALWQHLLGGDLPMVASDHSPAPPDMKGGGDFFSVWGGISGCQSMLAVLLTMGHFSRKLPLSAVARITAGYVAQRFGVGARKGQLQTGADADMTLVNLNTEWQLRAEDLLYRHKHSPFTGMTFRGMVTGTILRGKTVYREGRIVSPPVGQFVPAVPRPMPKPESAPGTTGRT